MKITWERIWILVFTLCTSAAAQIGALPPAGQQPKAQQLPLSGRPKNGSVVTQQTPASAGGPSVNTVNPSIQIQGPYQGSVPDGSINPQSIPLSLENAIKRGIQFNLGAIAAGEASRQARAQRLAAIAQLLPDVTGAVRETVQQENLAAEGIRINLPVPGFHFPSVVKFNNIDARASMTESLSLTGWRNWRASEQNARSAELSVQDSRDLIALAVAGTYLQLIATSARIDTAKAQIETAKAVYQQALDRDRNGLSAHIDVSRSLVEEQTQEVRLTSLLNDFEKQKIVLARLIGLPMAQQFTLADTISPHEVPAPNLDELIQRAFMHRFDVQAAAAQVRAAEFGKNAATGEYLPSLDINADYGAVGVTPTNQNHGTFTVAGAVQFPIFRSGRIRSDIGQADAALQQRKAEFEDAKAHAEQDVRTAALDLGTATRQMRVTESNRALAAETLEQARDRFRAGVADTVELVQAQESVANAEQDYITALFSFSLAEISLARAVGETEQGVVRLLQGK